MSYRLFPPVRSMRLIAGSAFETRPQTIETIRRSIAGGVVVPGSAQSGFRFDLDPELTVGEQGFRLRVGAAGVALTARDAAGFRYGLDTLDQILAQSPAGRIDGLDIEDAPVLKNRGLMLDISRGKVYTRDYLLGLVELLAKCRMNILQLYTEHTFQFPAYPEIWAGADPLTAEDIRAIGDQCEACGIEFQANLQSLGHMNRILTRPQFLELAESDMHWSLDTTNEASYELLDKLYAQYLPLFASPWLNVCSDEPYDLGRGNSSRADKSVGELYFDHLKRLHGLASQYGKKIMLFGDVVKHHPEFARQMPADVIVLDWIYDPKPVYGSPELFQAAGLDYWVSPGTGNWNTLFPRLDGSITNIVNLTLEGAAHGTQGMLLTDWNDHGGYTQPSPAYYLYAYAAAVAWSGADPGPDEAGEGADRILDLPGYSRIIRQLGAIYQLPPMWSKNRSQCVMALFDEPVTGASIRGQDPPDSLKAYDLELPPGVDHVFERHSQHPLRPVFRIPESTRRAIGAILDNVAVEVAGLKEGEIREQLSYIIRAFDLMLDKLAFSDGLTEAMASRSLDEAGFVHWEDQTRQIIARMTDLELDYIRRWCAIARTSEIAISLSYFSGIIARLEYLRDWLSIQRENIRKSQEPDWTFTTYQTAGYTTLPTY